MEGLQKRLEIFFLSLPEETKFIYRSDENCLYIGINKNLIQTCIDLIESKLSKTTKTPA